MRPKNFDPKSRTWAVIHKYSWSLLFNDDEEENDGGGDDMMTQRGI